MKKFGPSLVLLVIVVAMTVGLLFYLRVDRKESIQNSVKVETTRGDKPSRLKLRDIRLETASPRADSNPMDAGNKTEPCKNTYTDILRSPADTLNLASGNIRDCLVSHGLEPNCQNAASCLDSVNKAKLSIIDSLGQSQEKAPMPASVAASKIAVLVKSDFKGKDEQIFELSNIIIEKYPDLNEAHNLRSFYGFQSLVSKWDEATAGKISDSAEVLKASPNIEEHKKGEMVDYALAILSYARQQNESALEKAEYAARDFINNYPNESVGYYMLMQVYGYRDDFKNTLQYLEKGLSFGPNQDEYGQYQKVKEILVSSGKVDKNIIGLRVDLRRYFNIDEIMNSVD